MKINDLEEFLVKYNDPEYEMEIYNEFSLQHELGIFLREKYGKKYKVEFERNVCHFLEGERAKEEGKNFVKHEIDIVVYNDNKRYAIELKYPKNGQVPVQMFSFIKDINFMEQVKKAGFTKTFVMTIVDPDTGNGFYNTSLKSDGIYQFFRTNGKSQIHGKIDYPCNGKEVTPLDIKGSYSIEWRDMPRNLKGYILEI